MGSPQWVFLLSVLLFSSLSHASSLKLLADSPITTTLLPLSTQSTTLSTPSVDQTSPSTATSSLPLSAPVSLPTTESPIEHLVAFTSSSSDEEEILQTEKNETISLDEFDSNSTPPLSTMVVPKGMIRQCQCTEVLDCKLKARNETENCFEMCDEQLGFLGNDTHSYMDCFEKNQGGVIHAEDCMESALGNVCSPSTIPQFLEARDHEDYVKTKFITNKEPKASLPSPRPLLFSLQKTRPLLHKTHHVLSSFHEFFHCTKKCIHKRMIGCMREKNCSIRLPSLPSFGEIMSSCAKNNIKASRSLRSTCQCLVHKKKLKQLSGTCALMTPRRVKTL